MKCPAAIAASVLIAVSASLRAQETDCVPFYTRLPEMEPAETDEELHWRDHPSVGAVVVELAAPLVYHVARDVWNCARTESQQTEPCSIRWLTDWLDETQELSEVEEQTLWPELTSEQERMLIDFAIEWAATKRVSDSTASTLHGPPGRLCTREETGYDVRENYGWKGDTYPWDVQRR